MGCGFVPPCSTKHRLERDNFASMGVTPPAKINSLEKLSPNSVVKYFEGAAESTSCVREPS